LSPQHFHCSGWVGGRKLGGRCDLTENQLFTNDPDKSLKTGDRAKLSELFSEENASEP
jgi:hypothetical protein